MSENVLIFASYRVSFQCRCTRETSTSLYTFKTLSTTLIEKVNKRTKKPKSEVGGVEITGSARVLPAGVALVGYIK